VHNGSLSAYCLDMSGGRPINAPSYQRLALEQLALWEYYSFMVASPYLGFIAHGDGHPVLVLPGFTTSDRSTKALRAVLGRNGHDARGWQLGRNMGAHPLILHGLDRRLVELHEASGRRVSLLGWSLGGMFARELARRHPEMVRTVITLASPFRIRGGDRSHASVLYDRVGPPVDPLLGDLPAEERRPPLPVPSTSIYTRADGVVRWHMCIDTVGPSCENIEVFGTHSGLGYNIAAVIAVADRLARPEGEWQPFRPPAGLSCLFPRPVSWAPEHDRVQRLAS
jgi:pimeloyl-ACP methyl ester carboxylesterase